MSPSIKISPSILSADFGRMNEEIASVEEYVDWIHIDVMDGHFVPNLTFGAPVVKCFQTKLPKDCHLMITNPEKYLEDFKNAGAASITIHVEIEADVTETLKKIRALGIKAGLCLKPKTPVSAIEKYLDLVDLVLVMTVEPGFGGQAFMPECVPKITELRKLRPELDISVDGGINAETSKIVRAAGANVLVAGAAILKAPDRVAAIKAIRGDI